MEFYLRFNWLVANSSVKCLLCIRKIEINYLNEYCYECLQNNFCLECNSKTEILKQQIIWSLMKQTAVIFEVQQKGSDKKLSSE